jgi:hypothetical protein
LQLKKITEDTIKPPARESVLGALILDAPGTFVSEAEDGLMIGIRPGVLHYSIAVGVPAFCLVLLWILRHDAWWVGAGALALFGLPSILVLFNSQRYEVTRGRVVMRGRAAGFRVNRDWPLAGDSAVRIGTRLHRDEETAFLWTSYLAQILTNQGWIPIAESMQRDRVVEFAERLARAADVKILND